MTRSLLSRAARPLLWGGLAILAAGCAVFESEDAAPADTTETAAATSRTIESAVTPNAQRRIIADRSSAAIAGKQALGIAPTAPAEETQAPARRSSSGSSGDSSGAVASAWTAVPKNVPRLNTAQLATREASAAQQASATQQTSATQQASASTARRTTTASATSSATAAARTSTPPARAASASAFSGDPRFAASSSGGGLSAGGAFSNPSSTSASTQRASAQQTQTRAAPANARPRGALAQCWTRPDAGDVDPRSLIVILSLSLSREGALTGTPDVLRPTGDLTERQRTFVKAAQEAVAKCAPYRFPPRTYESWKTFRVVFDPVANFASPI